MEPYPTEDDVPLPEDIERAGEFQTESASHPELTAASSEVRVDHVAPGSMPAQGKIPDVVSMAKFSGASPATSAGSFHSAEGKQAGAASRLRAPPPPLNPSPSVASADAQPIVREFQCQFPGCEKVFSKKFNMQTHMRLHSGVKPYVCSKGCGTAFMWMSSRNRHEVFCGQGYFRHRRSGSAPPLSADKARFATILPSLPPAPALPPTPAESLPASLSSNPVPHPVPHLVPHPAPHPVPHPVPHTVPHPIPAMTDPQLVFEPTVPESVPEAEPDWESQLNYREDYSPPRRTRSYSDACMEDSPREKDSSPRRKTMSLEEILDIHGVAPSDSLSRGEDLGQDVGLPDVLGHDSSNVFPGDMASVTLDAADIPPNILDQNDEFKEFRD